MHNTQHIRTEHMIQLKALPPFPLVDTAGNRSKRAVRERRALVGSFGAAVIMASRLSVLLLVLAVSAVTVLAQRRRPASKATNDWNYKDGSDRVNIRNVANLTEVLDNWRFDIINQMKGLLQNDHQALLPDYARIQPLSEALDDLYKEFNALKTHLGDLTEKFTAIETFIDEVKASRSSNANANANSNTNTNADSNAGSAVASAARQPSRRLVRKKPSTSS